MIKGHELVYTCVFVCFNALSVNQAHLTFSCSLELLIISHNFPQQMGFCTVVMAL